MRRLISIFSTLLLLGLAAGVASATVHTLPNSSETTTLTANVSEQCDITVPAGVTFNVTDIASSTPASAATVTITNIVLATATKQLKVSIQASAASFTPSVGGAVTWDAANVSWNAATWANGTGVVGTLSSGGYNEVATAAADAATTSTANLVFTLAAKPTVKRSGNHTLVVTWQVESIGT
jgi:hypothetical protein